MKQFRINNLDIQDTIVGRFKGKYVIDSQFIEMFFVGLELNSCQNFLRDNEIRNFNFKVRESQFELNGSSILDSIYDGDIIVLNESGICTVAYETNSSSNTIVLNDTCNSQCIICSQPYHESDDNTTLAIAILKLIENAPKNLAISGGEPTLNIESLKTILNYCNENFKETSIELLTNGRNLKNFEFCKFLSDFSNDKLSICIPLYSDNYIIHDAVTRVPGSFWEAIEGIYNVTRMKIPIEIRNVIIRQNYKRLPAWSEFLFRHFPFVSHVAIMGLEPIGRALDNINHLWIDPLYYSTYLAKAVINLYLRDINVSIYNHQLCTIPRNIWEFSRKAISEWKNVYLQECSSCEVKEECGGFFRSNLFIHSKGIGPIVV